jgi:hypothetical protein
MFSLNIVSFEQLRQGNLFHLFMHILGVNCPLVAYSDRVRSCLWAARLLWIVLHTRVMR